MQYIRTIMGTMLLFIFTVYIGQAQNKYIGVKKCSMCHKSKKAGKQFDIWKKSKHAVAYKTLTTDRADSIAKAKGLKKPAAESPECLKCHVSGYNIDPKLVDKKFDYKDGVQCETCHNPGSGYKKLSTMKDRKKAIKAGLKEFKNDAAIEKYCKTCHNEESPVYKEFKFKERWKKIIHAKPKS